MEKGTYNLECVIREGIAVKLDLPSLSTLPESHPHADTEGPLEVNTEV